MLSSRFIPPSIRASASRHAGSSVYRCSFNEPAAYSGRLQSRETSHTGSRANPILGQRDDPRLFDRRHSPIVLWCPTWKDVWVVNVGRISRFFEIILNALFSWSCRFFFYQRTCVGSAIPPATRSRVTGEGEEDKFLT